MKKSFNQLIINGRTYIIDDTYIWIDGRKATGQWKKHIKQYCPNLYLNSSTVQKQIKEQDRIYNLYALLDKNLYNETESDK